MDLQDTPIQERIPGLWTTWSEDDFSKLIDDFAMKREGSEKNSHVSLKYSKNVKKAMCAIDWNIEILSKKDLWTPSLKNVLTALFK